MNKFERNRRWFFPLLGLILTAYFYLINPAEGTGLPCLLHQLTGLKCWGCGGQRAFHQLLHGHFLEAAALNILVFPVVILGCYILYAESLSKQADYGWLRKNPVPITTLILLMGFSILRNLI